MDESEVDAKRTKGVHAGRQLHIGSALFSARIALQKAIAPITQLSPTSLPESKTDTLDTSDWHDAKYHLTRLAWNIAQLQQEMLDDLIPENGEDNENWSEKNQVQGRNGNSSQRDREKKSNNAEDESDLSETSQGDEADDERETKRARLENMTPYMNIQDEEYLLNAMEETCRRHHTRLLPYMNKTVDKWYTKTKLASGTDKGFKALDQSLMTQISSVTREKLRSHTTEKFDDTSFYLGMLREHLESKKNFESMTPVEMARHFLELDALRTRVKNKVDTRASKGRKLRFKVHPKLMNFMAPDDTVYGADTMSAAQQGIFASLFKND